jgi:hypothetical protein
VQLSDALTFIPDGMAGTGILPAAAAGTPIETVRAKREETVREKILKYLQNELEDSPPRRRLEFVGASAQAESKMTGPQQCRHKALLAEVR